MICTNCGVQNPPNMSFCSNCGHSLADEQEAARRAGNPGSFPNSNAAELPPTVFQFQQPNAQPQTPFQPPVMPGSASTPPAPPANKSRTGLWLGLLGCGGLLVIGIIATVVGVVYLNNSGSNVKKTDFNINTANSKTSNVANVNKSANKTLSADGSMMSEMQKLKQVGEFHQTDLKAVNASDYFPSATEVVQATYTDGKKYVVSTLGKFPSNDVAFEDYDTQIKNVKGGSGTIYSNESKNGTKAAAYKYKNYYFIEACGDAVCSRNNSDDINALRSFATSFGTAVSNSSNQ